MHSVEEIIRKEGNLFIRYMMLDLNEYRMGKKTIAGFSCFDSLSSSHHIQEYMEKRMESRVRDILVNRVFSALLRRKGVTASFPRLADETVPSMPVLSNSEYEELVGFEFIINCHNKTTGIRYTKIPKGSTCLSNDDSVDEIVIINWSNLTNPNGDDILALPAYGNIPVKQYTPRAFFLEHFDIDTYNTFIIQIENPIYRFQNYIGVTTVPKLTAPLVLDYRFEIENAICNYIREFKRDRDMADRLEIEYRNEPSVRKSFHYGYQIIYDETRRKYPSLEKNSEMVMIKSSAMTNFIRDKLWDILIGRSDFARSLMTAEYLYRNYECDSKFDYTAIISGYVKCIEQLLYQIALLYLGTGCYITPNKQAPKERCRQIKYPYNDDEKPRIEFCKENEEYFDITLGALCYFLKDNDQVVHYDGKWKNTLVQCLFTFVKECRNDHFHKHNIDNWARVEYIRKNTFFLCVLLLGSCNIDKSNKQLLGAAPDDRLERIYNYLKMSKYEDYILQFEGDEPEKVKRVPDIMVPNVDDYGFIKSVVLLFVSPDKLDSDGNRMSYTIHKGNIPTKMWAVNKKGKRIALQY